MLTSILILCVCQTEPPAKPRADLVRPVARPLDVRTIAPAEPLPPRVPPEKVIADFFAAVEKNDAYDAQARSFVAAERDKLTGDDPADTINQAYAILSTRFKAGLDLMAAEKPTQAADAFEALIGDKDPFLSIAAAGLAATNLAERDDIDRCSAMLARVFTAHPQVDLYTPAPYHLSFMRAYCQVHDLQYEQAQASFTDFLRRFPDAPERMRVSATQILTELASRAPGRLGDVCDLMGYARRRIDHGDTGEKVKERQAKAVELLDVLIEEAEEQEKNQGEGDGSGEGRGGGGNPQGNQQPGGPANRSSAPDGQDRVGELRQQRAKPGEAWGKMPPKEREKILQTLQKQFPSQYRELLEQYYKQLAKDAKQP